MRRDSLYHVGPRRARELRARARRRRYVPSAVGGGLLALSKIADARVRDLQPQPSACELRPQPRVLEAPVGDGRGLRTAAPGGAREDQARRALATGHAADALDGVLHLGAVISIGIDGGAHD